MSYRISEPPIGWENEGLDKILRGQMITRILCCITPIPALVGLIILLVVK